MRTLTILTFAAFIAVPTFVAAQSMTAQQYHREKGPSLISLRRNSRLFQQNQLEAALLASRRLRARLVSGR